MAALPLGSTGAQECARAAIVTLPSVTWGDIAEVRPPNILDAVGSGASGSMSVRTISSSTTPASGYASIGAGARVDGGSQAGGSTRAIGDGLFSEGVVAAAWDDIDERLDEAGYSTVVPGALAQALGESIDVIAVGNSDLGLDPASVAGHGRWTLLAAADASGRVDRAAVGPELLIEDATAPFGVRTNPQTLNRAIDQALAGCSIAVIDQGDLGRVDAAEQLAGKRLPRLRAEALLAADDALEAVRDRLDERRDLLLVVSPMSYSWDVPHFGVVIAVGPGYPAGSSLSSASTGRPGIVTLPDIAPTVLKHLGFDRDSSMIGRSLFTRSADAADRISEAVDLDGEAVFVDRWRTPVSTAFVVFQVFVFLLIVPLLFAREQEEGNWAEGRLGKILQAAALFVVGFPVSTYLLGIVDQHELGAGWFFFLLIVVDAALVAAAWLAGRSGLGRLLVLTAFTTAVIAVDTLVGAPLQLNTVFSYSPLVAGRFAGIGNIAFSVLTASSLITATLIVDRLRGSSRALMMAAALFVLTIVIDAAPQFGADVGGILALVPGFTIAWLLLAKRRITWRVAAVITVAVIAAGGLFLAWDLARPEDSQTHLARLYEDVRDRGSEVFVNALDRKITTNIRVFRSTIWTYLVPPALAFMGWLLMRPRGRWESLASRYPRLRAGLISGLVLGIIGFAVNDSGIVIPALILSFLAPMALVIHLKLEAEKP